MIFVPPKFVIVVRNRNCAILSRWKNSKFVIVLKFFNDFVRKLRDISCPQIYAMRYCKSISGKGGTRICFLTSEDNEGRRYVLENDVHSAELSFKDSPNLSHFQ